MPRFRQGYVLIERYVEMILGFSIKECTVQSISVIWMCMTLSSVGSRGCFQRSDKASCSEKMDERMLRCLADRRLASSR